MRYKQVFRLFTLLLIIFSININLKAQDKSSLKVNFTEAETYFLYEEFTEALPLYIQLKDKYPGNYNLDYKIGRCFLNMPYDKQKSIQYLENAIKHISIIYKESSFKELNAPLDALFYLGDAYRINNQLARAIQTYQEFKQRVSDKVFDFSLVDHEIQSCEQAMIMEKKPIDETEMNIGDVINTRFSETNPVVSADENMIVYAVKLQFYQAMFYSKKVDGKWTTPINMIPELGIDGDCFPTSLSADGTELYMYRNNEYQGDLFVSNYKNGKWNKIKKLNGNINTKYWESHACISPDGLTLYFTSNRDGGYGGLDIYKSTRPSVTSNDWGVPQNLGPVINSPYNDDTPFITEDGKRLYFSSFGHESMGGYDIFYSDLSSDGTWSKPVNLGYPINTTGDELFFDPLMNGNFGYMAKFDPKGFGKYDIFRYEIFSDRHPRKYIINVKITLPQSQAGTYISVNLYDKVKGDTVLHKIATTDTFSFETTAGDFNVYLKAKGCKPQVVNLSIPMGSKDKGLLITTSLLSITDSESTLINFNTPVQTILVSIPETKFSTVPSEN